MTDLTPHESLPLQEGQKRQWFRLVMPCISVWYSKHSTPNPLGVVPPGPVTIIDYDKFEGPPVLEAKAKRYNNHLTASASAPASAPEDKDEDKGKYGDAAMNNNDSMLEETKEGKRGENENSYDDTNVLGSDDDTPCEVCKSMVEKDMLLCGTEDGKGCGRGFHIHCLSPPLDSVPEGDWFCSDCCSLPSGSGSSSSPFTSNNPSAAPATLPVLALPVSDLWDYTGVQLREGCRERSLHVFGSKAALIARLQEHNQETELAPAALKASVNPKPKPKAKKAAPAMTKAKMAKKKPRLVSELE